MQSVEGNAALRLLIGERRIGHLRTGLLNVCRCRGVNAAPDAAMAPAPIRKPRRLEAKGQVAMGGLSIMARQLRTSNRRFELRERVGEDGKGLRKLGSGPSVDGIERPVSVSVFQAFKRALRLG